MKSLLLAVLLPSLASSRKVEFVQAFWRHGDRAPNALPYPNDPYTEDDWPRGFQQLTSIGIGQLNELGQFFRNRYGNFVNSTYYPNEAYMRSSDVDRALASAQSFLSGFYPAQGLFQWENGNAWQPIPVHGSTQGTDDLLCHATSIDCPKWKKMVKEDDERDAEVYNKKYADMFALLANTTGISNFSYVNVDRIYNVHRELIHNLTELQPDWVFQTWPQYENRTTLDICTELRARRFFNEYGTYTKGRYFGGYLLNQWIQNAENVAARRQKNPSRMFWFSSHDTTLMSLMYTMGIGPTEMVPYAACLIMEVYSEGNDFFVDVFYRNDSLVEPHRLLLPGCADPCPVSSLQNIYKDVVLKTPDDVKEHCGATIESCSAKETGSSSSLAPLHLIFSIFIALIL